MPMPFIHTKNIPQKTLNYILEKSNSKTAKYTFFNSTLLMGNNTLITDSQSGTIYMWDVGVSPIDSEQNNGFVSYMGLLQVKDSAMPGKLVKKISHLPYVRSSLSMTTVLGQEM